MKHLYQRIILFFTVIIFSLFNLNAQTISNSYSYVWHYDTIYNIINGSQNFSYTGTVQTFTAPAAGTYTLEVWGAQGGISGHCTGNYGKGGYSVGILNLTSSTTLYVHVGGQGTAGTTSKTTPAGGWNGGGAGGYGENDNAGAGGGTDISLYGAANGSTTWNTTTHLYSRIIVAGGAS